MPKAPRATGTDDRPTNQSPHGTTGAVDPRPPDDAATEPTPPHPSGADPTIGDDGAPPPGARAGPDRWDADDGRVSQLLDTDHGRWQITTEASIYVLDLDDRWFLRAPGAGPHADGHVVAANTLPHDHHPLRLLHLVRCKIGERMWLLGDPHPDGSIGRRASTTVLDIHPAGDGASATGAPRTPASPGGAG